jgi:tetratricopeptide (TPR) repeat protein
MRCNLGPTSPKISDSPPDTGETRRGDRGCNAQRSRMRSLLKRQAVDTTRSAGRALLQRLRAPFETALAFNRNAVGTRLGLGRCKLLTGSIDETISLVEQAIRLSPRDPYIAVFYCQIAYVHLLASRVEEAIAWLEKARSANPAHPSPHAYLASAYALNGEGERAAVELAEARRQAADDRYASLARLRAVDFWGVPKIRALFEATYFAGLRLAGMPEE